MVDVRAVGVLGATSLVGEQVLLRLVGAGCPVVAYTRGRLPVEPSPVRWRQLPPGPDGTVIGAVAAAGEHVPFWICLAPIWVLPQYFMLLEASGARRVVALSSTSRFSKADSVEPCERELVQRLVAAEAQLQAWAARQDVEWVILRPTLIYGAGRDRNLTLIAGFIRRFGFFPLFGSAAGLRQPVHAGDVAAACQAALTVAVAAGKAYDLSGGETLSYREMAGRIFDALGRRRRLFRVPLGLFRLGLAMARLLPHYRGLSGAMVVRMNQDLVFDASAARADLGFAPRPFHPSADDL